MRYAETKDLIMALDFGLEPKQHVYAQVHSSERASERIIYIHMSHVCRSHFGSSSALPQDSRKPSVWQMAARQEDVPFADRPTSDRPLRRVRVRVCRCRLRSLRSRSPLRLRPRSRSHHHRQERRRSQDRAKPRPLRQSEATTERSEQSHDRAKAEPPPQRRTQDRAKPRPVRQSEATSRQSRREGQSGWTL